VKLRHAVVLELVDHVVNVHERFDDAIDLVVLNVLHASIVTDAKDQSVAHPCPSVHNVTIG
jgi:hypothetical protein